MAYKLDLKDKKLLIELDKNARQPFSELGKKTGLSREVAEYRVKNLFNSGIIKRFFTEYNYAKIGFQAFRICLSFHDLTQKKEDEIYEFFLEANCLVFIIGCSGKWDMIIGFSFPNIREFNTIFKNFQNKFSSIIFMKEFLIINRLEIFNKKWLLENPELRRHSIMETSSEKIKLDEIDKSIINSLSQDCRKTIVSIAKALNLSTTAIINRIKNMEISGLISAYRIELDLEELGKEYCQVFIYFNEKTELTEKKFISYCRQHPNIVTLFQTIGKWDYELEIEVKNVKEFNEIMKDLKKKLPFVKNYDSVIITKNYGPVYNLN